MASVASERQSVSDYGTVTCKIEQCEKEFQPQITRITRMARYPSVMTEKPGSARAICVIRVICG
jgi:hypothetical protein